MKAALVGFAVLVAIVGGACNKKEDVVMAPMGDASPAFGSGNLTTLQAFVVGRWCVVDGMGGVNTKRYFEFKPDGSFETGVVDGDYVSTGKWASMQDNVMLTYETMKGKPYEAYRAEYKKDEEGGGQVSVQRALVFDQVYAELDRMRNVWVDEDGKHLTFSQPEPPSAGGDMEDAMDSISRGVGIILERMAPQKSE